MPCSRTEHLLREYLADDLLSVMRAEIEQHVADCPDCAAELRHLHGAAHSLGQWRELPTPRWDRHLALFRVERADASQGWRFLWQWLPVAACTLMLGLLLINTSVLYRAGTLEISFGNPFDRDIEDFTGGLAEALGLETAADPFDPTAERIHSSYLADRGLVLEVRSNLAAASSRLRPAMVDSPGNGSLHDGNPTAILAPAIPQQSSTEPGLTDIDARHPHRDLLLRASQIDTAELVNSAIVQAGEHARILRDADGIGSEDFARLREQIEALRQQKLAVSDRLGEFIEGLRRDTAAGSESVAASLDELAGEMNQLRSRAQDFAAELRQRSESAQASRTERWRNDIANLEQRLASALCSHDASLRQLPEQETITVILTGLGEPTPARPVTDLIHIYAQSDILQCANGVIDPATLTERSNPYSY